MGRFTHVESEPPDPTLAHEAEKGSQEIIRGTFHVVAPLEHCHVLGQEPLVTPRNRRRKFRSPVHRPSCVLQCTSRSPSPSRSSAQVPWGPSGPPSDGPDAAAAPPGCIPSTRPC